MRPVQPEAPPAPAVPPPGGTSIEIGNITVEILASPPQPQRESRPAAPSVRRIRARAGRAPSIHRFGLGQV
jgi:hypothetical protein